MGTDLRIRSNLWIISSIIYHIQSSDLYFILRVQIFLLHFLIQFYLILKLCVQIILLILHYIIFKDRIIHFLPNFLAIFSVLFQLFLILRTLKLPKSCLTISIYKLYLSGFNSYRSITIYRDKLIQLRRFIFLKLFRMSLINFQNISLKI